MSDGPFCLPFDKYHGHSQLTQDYINDDEYDADDTRMFNETEFG